MKIHVFEIIYFDLDLMTLTSVTQKNVPSTVVYYYCAWYIFLCNRRAETSLWDPRCETYEIDSNSGLTIILFSIMILWQILRDKQHGKNRWRNDLGAYAMWPLYNFFQNWIVDRSTACDFTGQISSKLNSIPLYCSRLCSTFYSS